MVGALPALEGGRFIGSTALCCVTAFFDAEIAERSAEGAEKGFERPSVALAWHRSPCLAHQGRRAASSFYATTRRPYPVSLQALSPGWAIATATSSTGQGFKTMRACSITRSAVPTFRHQPRDPPQQSLCQSPQRCRLFQASPSTSRLAAVSCRNGFVILRTTGSPPVALHPAFQRRSYLRLPRCDQPGHGFAAC